MIGGKKGILITIMPRVEINYIMPLSFAAIEIALNLTPRNKAAKL
jgi:hypothetical protein